LHAFFGQHILLLKGVKALGFYANQRLNGGHSTAMSHHGNPAPAGKSAKHLLSVGALKNLAPITSSCMVGSYTVNKTSKHSSRAA
jgi:hypothetical protein